ncbi:zinc-binding dehydrogenase, partial [Anaerobacillus sp. 1_MG-2023]|uniref:zinc-binding dehydrogenase n=1 Tax=Anaerobacillus sp. 1_MG-2023 TaxID=3062655 RepID=UPI0026E2A900
RQIQEDNFRELFNSLTDGYGADVLFECSGAVPAANQGLDLLRKKGQYAQVGFFANPEVLFDLEKIIQKVIRVIGSRS